MQISHSSLSGTRKWAFVASFAAASVGSRIAMAALPNIKLVAFFAAMSGIIGGPFAGFLVGFLSMLGSDAVFFGVGFWTLVTSSGMGLVGLFGGILWFGRSSKFPSRLELGVLGYLITLAYDLFTSLINLPLLLLFLYDAPATAFYALFSLVLGLFVPMGGFLWPAGPAHELTTALLLALSAPAIVKRLNIINLNVRAHGKNGLLKRTV